MWTNVNKDDIIIKKKGYWLCILYTYKNYDTIIHFYEKNKLFYGELKGITDSVSLNGETLDIIEQNCKNKWNFDDKKMEMQMKNTD